MKRLTRVLLASCLLMPVAATAQPKGSVPVGERAKGAKRVVVATVTAVTPAFDQNEFGDRLIISHAELAVEESLKGPAGANSSVVELDVEGGTIGDLTLHVSDLQSLTAGDRGVFFVSQDRRGRNVPYLRGLGILKLDKTNHVQNSNLTLDEVKSQVKQGLR